MKRLNLFRLSKKYKMQICLSILLFIILINFSLAQKDIYDIYLFQNEICSYNGKSKIIQVEGNDFINCTCKEQYATDPKIRKINNNPVQCSYEKKRRLLALTLAIFLPFGMDYLYLGYIITPIIIMVVFLLIIILNCRFYCKKEEKERENSDNGIIEVKVNKQEARMNLILLGIFFIYLIWYIVDIFLIGFGVIKDANGYPMYNDLFFYKN